MEYVALGLAVIALVQRRAFERERRENGALRSELAKAEQKLYEATQHPTIWCSMLSKCCDRKETV